MISKEQVMTALNNALPNETPKINELLKMFEASNGTVYCEDCNLLFFSGKAGTIANEKRYVDWKMLAFRHVWDTKHKVVVQLPFMGLATFPLSGFVPLIDPQDSTKFLYWKSVEEFRSRLLSRGSFRALRSNDKNWDTGSRCVCSTCGKSYYDPKEACYCCYGTKPWIPYAEADTIKVRVVNETE